MPLNLDSGAPPSQGLPPKTVGIDEHAHHPTAHRRSRDIAHDGIRDAVLNGDLVPGEQLMRHAW